MALADDIFTAVASDTFAHFAGDKARVAYVERGKADITLDAVIGGKHRRRREHAGGVSHVDVMAITLFVNYADGKTLTPKVGHRVKVDGKLYAIEDVGRDLGDTVDIEVNANAIVERTGKGRQLRRGT